jgi:hypothetical protein
VAVRPNPACLALLALLADSVSRSHQVELSFKADKQAFSPWAIGNDNLKNRLNSPALYISKSTVVGPSHKAA